MPDDRKRRRGAVDLRGTDARYLVTGAVNPTGQPPSTTGAEAAIDRNPTEDPEPRITSSPDRAHLDATSQPARPAQPVRPNLVLDIGHDLSETLTSACQCHGLNVNIVLAACRKRALQSYRSRLDSGATGGEARSGGLRLRVNLTISAEDWRQLEAQHDPLGVDLLVPLLRAAFSAELRDRVRAFLTRAEGIKGPPKGNK